MTARSALVLFLGLALIQSLGSETLLAADRYASRQTRSYNGPYGAEYLDQIAFPLGGIGAGMVCLQGSGCLSHVSIRHQPEIFNEPQTFAAVCVTSPKRVARLIEGPVPGYKILLPRGGSWSSSGDGAASKGASLYVPFALDAGQSKTIRLLMAWYVPRSDIRTGQHAPVPGEQAEGDQACSPDGNCCPGDAPPKHYVPYYAGRFASADEVLGYWRENYDRLHHESAAFRDCFFDTTLPPEVVEAVAANPSSRRSSWKDFGQRTPLP